MIVTDRIQYTSNTVYIDWNSENIVALKKIDAIVEFVLAKKLHVF